MNMKMLPDVREALCPCLESLAITPIAHAFGRLNYRWCAPISQMRSESIKEVGGGCFSLGFPWFFLTFKT